MYLDYSKLPFDRDGIPETPVLVLKTLGGKTMGTLPGVFNLKLNIKFSEPSEISFDIPAVLDGAPNPLYEKVTGHRQIYTEHYGIYETMNPTTEDDGIYKVKHVKGYSFEKTLDGKKFYLSEGTYNFWNPATPDDTVLGIALSYAPGWKVGYVSPSLMGRYRTFEDYDDYLLPFFYNHAPEKYRCVFVFDVYARTVNAYDAEEELPKLPIYLDFDNLLKQVEVEEISDELCTALRPYGADGLDIRSVNPTGLEWIFDLSYFLDSGDIGGALREKWEAWQQKVRGKEEYYRGLTALEASATAQLLAAKAKLNDMNGPDGEMDALLARQNITIQTLARETTQAGKDSQQAVLDGINGEIQDLKAAIRKQEGRIGELEKLVDPDEPGSYANQISGIVRELSMEENFTAEEQRELSYYFIQSDMTEDTFAATDIDASVSGSFLTLADGTASVNGSRIVRVSGIQGKTIYTMEGGRFSLPVGSTLSGDIIRGVLDVGADGDFNLSLYAGAIRAGDKTAQSGMVAVSGTMDSIKSDIKQETQDDILTFVGSALSLIGADGNVYLTANVSDYQRYAVETELYEYARKALREAAYPAYEFSVDSGNFLFAKEFAPFRRELELGKGVYLNLGSGEVIHPYIIEFTLDFEDRSEFTLVFSSRFKRHDYVNSLRDMIEQSYSSSRSFDAAKYLYNQAAGQASAVSKFMASSLDAAKNHVLSAKAEVAIDGAGIHVGGDGDDQLRVTGSMIAMTDDGWETAKLAIGRFASPEIGEYWGVNAEVIGGKLFVGNNLIIENATDKGVMQFKVDATGAWLNNSTMVFQQDGGGKILMDPKYGIVAGTSSLFGTNGTTVLPGFIDKDGRIILDEDGMPKDSNFFLDLRDGTAYFRGKVIAESGEFNGIVKAQDFLLPSGDSMVSILNDDGKIKGDWLDLMGINIKNNAGDTVMTIDQGGVRFGTGFSPVMYQYSVDGTSWHDTMSANDKYRRESYDGGGTWAPGYQFKGTDGKNGANGSDGVVDYSRVNKILKDVYGISTTEITGDSVSSAYIYGANIIGGNFYCGSNGGFQLKSQSGGDIISMYPANDSGAFSANGPDGCIGAAEDILLAPGSGGAGIIPGGVYIIVGGQKKAVLHEGSTIHAVFA